MKKNIIIIIIIILFYSFSLIAQVEKSINSVQIGTVGVWFQNETKLSNSIALRTEVGLYTEIWAGSGFFMAPEISFEPRWYYNLKKRKFKNKDISNNSGNFLTIETSYRSSIFEFGTLDSKLAENGFSIIPKWGIRRNLGKRFNYELGVGIGYLEFINQKHFTLSDSDGIIVDAHIRIGYNF
ncbi:MULTISPECIES: hypothetical protein [unclassified Polaribacter]|uniref:hypothetical protein n=1 Tax=unclassified Polaribacter TaxID=196858 RepID=UPI0011BF6D66|nr:MULTISPECIES: hypothetical protein [unclassified Polaribacter]TXD53064.1 hypothetical protein ES043_05895 [Polaribacter sp. IC063]TXD59013.1 hypothetical protein ES044_10830 [Polaribacter sp. IC066]